MHKRALFDEFICPQKYINRVDEISLLDRINTGIVCCPGGNIKIPGNVSFIVLFDRMTSALENDMNQFTHFDCRGTRTFQAAG